MIFKGWAHEGESSEWCGCREAGLVSSDAVQAKGFSPAPSAGKGAVEDRACWVSGRTDSITR